MSIDEEKDILVKKFIEAGNYDVEIIEVLLNCNIPNILIFYHLQQAIEKFLKAAWIHFSTSNQIYDQIKKLGHNAEKISFKLILEICNDYRNQLERLKAGRCTHTGIYSCKTFVIALP